MRVLVTGASGFIGRHAVDAVAGHGVDVHACSRIAQPARPGVTWHRADLLNASETYALVRQVRAEALLHCAWFATPPDYWTSPQNLQWTVATLRLADAFARTGGVRFVGVGTCAEYSWADGLCQEGVTPIRPSSLYGACKAAVWTALEPFAREMRLSTAWARPFFVYGPDEAASRLVPSLVSSIRAGRPAICRTANYIRDYIYVVDAGEAIAALTLSAVQGAVNIASGDPIRVGAIARGIADRLERVDLLRLEDGPPESACVTASVDRLRIEVGWSPRTPLDAGLDETVAWWTNRRLDETSQLTRRN